MATLSAGVGRHAQIRRFQKVWECASILEKSRKEERKGSCLGLEGLEKGKKQMEHCGKAKNSVESAGIFWQKGPDLDPAVRIQGLLEENTVEGHGTL